MGQLYLQRFAYRDGAKRVEGDLHSALLDEPWPAEKWALPASAEGVQTVALDHLVRQLCEGPDDGGGDPQPHGQPDGGSERQPVRYLPEYLRANLEDRPEHDKDSIRENENRPDLVASRAVSHTRAVGRDGIERGDCVCCDCTRPRIAP